MKKFKKILFVSLAASLFLVSCGGGEAKKESPNGNTVVISQGATPKSLNPYMYNEIPGLAVSRQFYNCLFKKDDSGNVLPDLVDTYEYLSDTQLRLVLKKGIKFHNGDELKAEDVVYSLAKMKEFPGSSIMIEEIVKSEVVDDYTVDIFLRNSSAPLLAVLAHPLTSIINKKYVEANPNSLNDNPMGTGPYVFTSWGSGEKIEMKSFADYFDGAPKVDGVIFRTISEDSSRLAALETGEVDIVYGISPIDTKTVESRDNLALISEPSTATEYVTMNNSREIFKNKYLRQAINYAIDKQSIIDSVLLGKGSVANSVVNPKVFGYSPEAFRYDYNPEKAKELIAKSGIKNPSFTINVNDGNTTRNQVAQIIQANLKEVGIDVKIEILEWSAYLQKTADGDFDAFLGGWISGTSDADIVLYPLLDSKNIGASGNRSRFSNAEFDKEVEAARVVTDPEQRKAHYKIAQDIAQEEAPLAPLYYKNENIGYNKRVKGFVYDPTNMHKLGGLEIVK